MSQMEAHLQNAQRGEETVETVVAPVLKESNRRGNQQGHDRGVRPVERLEGIERQAEPPATTAKNRLFYNLRKIKSGMKMLKKTIGEEAVPVETKNPFSLLIDELAEQSKAQQEVKLTTSAGIKPVLDQLLNRPKRLVPQVLSGFGPGNRETVELPLPVFGPENRPPEPAVPEIEEVPVEQPIGRNPLAVLLAPPNDPAILAQGPPLGLEERMCSDEIYYRAEENIMPDRKIINTLYKKKRTVKSYAALTFFLKTKYFLKQRDHNMIHSLVIDARSWMTKNGHRMETLEDYMIVTGAVTAAFCIDSRELYFRATIKDPKNWDNMVHLNKTTVGDLGKAFVLPNTYKENTLIGSVLPGVKIPVASKPAF